MAYQCSNCGEEWETHPFLQLPCPTCHAPAGAWCRRPSGHSGPFTDIHVAREQAVLDAGLVKKCPAAVEREKPATKVDPAQMSLFLGG